MKPDLADQNILNTQIKPEKSSRNRKRMIAWWTIAFFLLVMAIIFIILWIPNRKKKNPDMKSITTTQTVEPKFVKGGELFFLNKSDTSKRKKITIEIADDEASRNRGLMFRRSMADSLGMLFIFEDSQPRSFWMENTFIPLDIIFVNEKMEIITLQKNAVPFSEASISSNGNAKYVIEVNGGFAENNGLKAGDRVRFNRQK